MELPITYPDILDLIPQRPPFVMVDELFYYSEQLSKSKFLISKECLLTENGHISEAGLTESIAQTAALSSGYKCRMNGTPPPVGFIGAIKGLKIDGYPLIGTVIETEVSFLHQIGPVSIINGRVLCQGNVVAECEMKIFLQGNE